MRELVGVIQMNLTKSKGQVKVKQIVAAQGTNDLTNTNQHSQALVHPTSPLTIAQSAGTWNEWLASSARDLIIFVRGCCLLAVYSSLCVSVFVDNGGVEYNG
jgi:hypothetical protein